MKNRLVAILMLSLFPLLSRAEPLVNDIQLVEALKKGSDMWEVRSRPDIKRIGNIERRASSKVAGYSSEVLFTTRWETGSENQGSHVTYEIRQIPTLILMPDNPAKNPLLLIHDSVTVNEEIMDRLVNNKYVKDQVEVIATGKHGFNEPWSKKSKYFSAEITPKNDHFHVSGRMDISDFSVKDMAEFFDGYVFRIAGFNQVIKVQGRQEYSKYYDEEAEKGEAFQKELFKKTHKQITDKRVFTSLVGWQLNKQVDEPESDLGHWEYDNIDASPDVNVFVEVINYGDYYKMMFFVPYDKDSGDAGLESVLQKMNDKLAGKMPSGASSVTAKDSPYKGLVMVEVKYDLSQGVMGKTIYSNAEDFDKFTNKHYRKLEKLAEKM